MTVTFSINPHDATVVDVWLGDVFIAELRPTETGFRIASPGRITTEHLAADGPVRIPRPMHLVDVIIEG